jgi:cytochrome P450
MEGPCADSEEKREPVKDIDTAVVDSLKVPDPNRPIREADILLLSTRAKMMDARAFATPKRLRPRRQVEPAHDESLPGKPGNPTSVTSQGILFGKGARFRVAEAAARSCFRVVNDGSFAQYGFEIARQ